MCGRIVASEPASVIRAFFRGNALKSNLNEKNNEKEKTTVEKNNSNHNEKSKSGVKTETETVDDSTSLNKLVRITDEWTDEDVYSPSFNVPPTGIIPCLIAKAEDGNVTAHFASMHFGLNMGSTLLVNARLESLVGERPKPTFKNLRHSGRCIILIRGFYEWLRTEKDQPIQPYFVHRKDEKWMLVAGLYRNLYEKRTRHGVIVVTRDATGTPFAAVHDRIPHMLVTLEHVRDWLSPELSWSDQVHAQEKDLMTFLTWYPVDKRVGKVTHNDASLLDLYVEEKKRKDPTQPSVTDFFKKRKTE